MAGALRRRQFLGAFAGGACAGCERGGLLGDACRPQRALRRFSFALTRPAPFGTGHRARSRSRYPSNCSPRSAGVLWWAWEDTPRTLFVCPSAPYGLREEEISQNRCSRPIQKAPAEKR